MSVDVKQSKWQVWRSASVNSLKFWLLILRIGLFLGLFLTINRSCIIELAPGLLVLAGILTGFLLGLLFKRTTQCYWSECYFHDFFKRTFWLLPVPVFGMIDLYFDRVGHLHLLEGVYYYSALYLALCLTVYLFMKSYLRNSIDSQA